MPSEPPDQQHKHGKTGQQPAGRRAMKAGDEQECEETERGGRAECEECVLHAGHLPALASSEWAHDSVNQLTFARVE